MTSAVIPVNRLERVKGRLEAVLGAAERRALMLATLATVLDAVRGAGLEPEILTASPVEFEAAGIRAGFIVEDDHGGGLNGQLERATAGRGQVLILHADLPIANAESVRALLEASAQAPGITIVRSGDGGTNAMLLRPAGCFALAYGRNSFAAHVRAAREAGFAVTEVVSPALAFDLDTVDDLRAFMAMPGWEAYPAGVVLRRAGIQGTIGRATEGAHHPKRPG